jgi:hypothetical protein
MASLKPKLVRLVGRARAERWLTVLAEGRRRRGVRRAQEQAREATSPVNCGPTESKARLTKR